MLTLKTKHEKKNLQRKKLGFYVVELHQKKEDTTFQNHASHQKLVAHAKTKVKEPFKIEHAFPKLVANWGGKKKGKKEKKS